MGFLALAGRPKCLKTLLKSNGSFPQIMTGKINCNKISDLAKYVKGTGNNCFTEVWMHDAIN